MISNEVSKLKFDNKQIKMENETLSNCKIYTVKQINNSKNTASLTFAQFSQNGKNGKISL